MVVRRILLVLAVLVFPASAGADTLVVSGNAGKASNWSAGKPKLSTPVLIPAGKEAVVNTTMESGGLKVEGRISGPGSIVVQGGISVPVGGDFDIAGAVKLTGFDELAFGTEEIYGYFDEEGYGKLTEPLTVRGSMNVAKGAIFATEGKPLTVAGNLYQTIGGDIMFGSSMVRVGEWQSYGEYGVLDASKASFIVDGPRGGLFEGERTDEYGSVTLEGASPVSRGPFTVLGALALNQTTSGPILLEGGRTIIAGSLSSNATAEHPVRVEAGANRVGEVKGEAVIDCGGCSVPANVELVGVKVE
jgi:hypothetical protein